MDDLINRQDAIDALKEKVFHNLSDEFYGAMQVLNELPSAQPEKSTCDLINRRDAIRWVKAECNPYGQPTLDYESGIKVIKHLERMPSAELEPYQEKLKEIAKELSEKFAYLKTCPNERDIILGYLGIKRPYELHCNTDCIITKCECNHHYTKSPSVEHKCGKWYSYSRFSMNKWEYGYGCTCCKEWSAKESNYCPNCGADMRGEEE